MSHWGCYPLNLLAAAVVVEMIGLVARNPLSRRTLGTAVGFALGLKRDMTVIETTENDHSRHTVVVERAAGTTGDHRMTAAET